MSSGYLIAPSPCYESGRRAVWTSVVLSLISMICATLVLPALVTEMDEVYRLMDKETALFKSDFNDIWTELMSLQGVGPAFRPQNTNRDKRHETFLDRLERKSYKGRQRLLHKLANPKSGEQRLLDESETYESWTTPRTISVTVPRSRHPPSFTTTRSSSSTSTPGTTTTTSTTTTTAQAVYSTSPVEVGQQYEVPPAAVEAKETRKCPKGPPGIKGEDGMDGVDGIPGVAGLPGSAGHMRDSINLNGCKMCPVGPPGPKGISGLPGIQGPPGQDGYPGSASPKSLKGPTGPIGNIGEPGPDGLDGPVGASGTDGIKFVKGLNGEPGPAGPTGQAGGIGEPGEGGLPGSAGQVGFLGHEGIPGKSGSSGTDGQPGSEGYPGIDRHYCNCPVRSLYLLALKKQNVGVDDYLRRFEKRQQEFQNRLKNDDDYEIYRKYNDGQAIPHYRLL